MNPTQIPVFLNLIASQSVLILAGLVAVAIIVSKWKDAPEAAALALPGFCLFILARLLSLIAQFATMQLAQTHTHSEWIGWISGSVTILSTMLQILFIALLLVAIFAGRKPASETSAK